MKNPNPRPLFITTVFVTGWIGALFAALSIGAGGVEASTVTKSISTLHTFTGNIAGGAPESPLVEGTNGYLYGTTSTGGSNGFGTIFREARSGGAPKILHSFPDSDSTLGGTGRFGGLARAGDGNFYGTTLTGGTGTAANGSIYRITTSGSYQTIYSFSSFGNGTNRNFDGAVPWAGLVYNPEDGNLYGTTQAGGPNGKGTIFRITTAGSFQRLYPFQIADGNTPQAALAIGADGALYGTTLGGGSSNQGTAFRVTTSGSFLTIHPFTNGLDGGSPNGLTALDDGNLYGTAQAGGANNWGCVFRMTTGGMVTPLYPFTNGTDGSVPVGNVILGPDGSLYGTTTNDPVLKREIAYDKYRRQASQAVAKNLGNSLGEILAIDDEEEFKEAVGALLEKLGNATDGNGHWVTINGARVFIKEGQSVEAALHPDGGSGSAGEEKKGENDVQKPGKPTTLKGQNELRTDHERGTLESAARDTAGDAQAVPGHGATLAERGERISGAERRLREWAEKNGKLGGKLPKEEKRGSEHIVQFDEKKGLVYKATRPEMHRGCVIAKCRTL